MFYSTESGPFANLLLHVAHESKSLPTPVNQISTVNRSYLKHLGQAFDWLDCLWAALGDGFRSTSTLTKITTPNGGCQTSYHR